MICDQLLVRDPNVLRLTFSLPLAQSIGAEHLQPRMDPFPPFLVFLEVVRMLLGKLGYRLPELVGDLFRFAPSGKVTTKTRSGRASCGISSTSSRSCGNRSIRVDPRRSLAYPLPFLPLHPGQVQPGDFRPRVLQNAPAFLKLVLLKVQPPLQTTAGSPITIALCDVGNIFERIEIPPSRPQSSDDRRFAQKLVVKARASLVLRTLREIPIVQRQALSAVMNYRLD